MTVPDWLMHYRFCPLPARLEPLAFLGVNDDLTSETRLDEDACREAYTWLVQQMGVTEAELMEILDVGLVAGGSIVIPHLRHAVETVDLLRAEQ